MANYGLPITVTGLGKISIQEATAGYALTPHVSKEMNTIKVEVIRDLKPLCQKLQLNIPRVVYIDDIEKNACASYISGTSPWPVIVLGYKEHYNWNDQVNDIDRYEGVESSVVHELCHAYLEHNGLECCLHDEDRIEYLTVRFCDGFFTARQLLSSLKEML
jgi:hypothetical protein